MERRGRWVALAFVCACGPEPLGGGDATAEGDGSTTSSTTSATTDGGVSSIDGGTDKLDAGPPDCVRTEPRAVDLLVVVENTPAMAGVQARLGGVATELVRTLEQATDARGEPMVLDVQLMFTTTDMGNPMCMPPPGYVPLLGGPLATGCNTRIDEFGAQPQVCTDACPFDLIPGGQFIAFVGDQATNVLDVPPVDVDGDGELDSPAAQAAACLAAAGLVGCDYASPLEAMRQALDPSASWNQGDQPFLRNHAALGIFIVEDGLDCSLADASVMDDPAFQEIDPQSGETAPSQAICWNAGVTCEGPDAEGVYQACSSSGNGLHPVARYADFLAQEVGDPACKGVFMIASIGVPHVISHNSSPPYQPVEGGVLELVYQDWPDPQKQFELGIGPACLGEDGAGDFFVQAVPDPRTIEVCQSLDARNDVRCCIESVCDDEHTGVMACLGGMVTPPYTDYFPD